jgi:hypothetical protein
MLYCTRATCQKERLPGKWYCQACYQTITSQERLQYPEQAMIRYLVDQRGFPFVVAFFKGVPHSRLIDMYHYTDVDEKVFEQIKQVLKERMPLE